MIVNCDCKHAGQDELHGPGRRVANWAPKTNGGKGFYRCTVCLKLHPGPAPTEQSKEKKP